jgi:hypothetical protein
MGIAAIRVSDCFGYWEGMEIRQKVSDMTLLTVSEQRMLNSPTFCEILLAENICIRFSGTKMA